MKKLITLSLVAGGLMITSGLSAQTSNNTNVKSPTLTPSTTTQSKGGSTTGTSTDGVNHGGSTNTTGVVHTPGTSDGKQSTGNTSPTGTSQKMAIGDQGAVENTKNAPKNTTPQITPKH